MRKLLDKWRGLPDSVKASVAFVLSNLLLRGVSFLTTPIFTRIMAQSEYGIMATYNSWLSIIDVFALLGMTSAGVFNVGMNDYRDSREQYMAAVLILDNFATVVVFAIIFFIKQFVNDAFMMPGNLLILMFIHFIFSPAQIFWITRQRYEYKYKLSTVVSVLSIFVGQLIAIVVVINVPNNQGTWKLWSNEIGALLFAIPLYVMILIRGKTCFDITVWKKVLAFALPLLPHYLAQHVMSGADRIMIGNLVSQSDAGIYNVVSNISMIAILFWNAINASLIPYTFEYLNDRRYNRISKTTEMLLLVYGVICISVMLVAPEVLRFLAPEEYYGGLYAIPPIAVVSFLNSLYNIYANIEFYHKKSSNIAVATTVSAVVNVGLNALLIPKFSYVGAAYTTLVSNIVLIGFHYFGYRKCSKERVYNDKHILLILLTVVLSSFLCNLLYINNLVRYISLIILFTILIMKRKQIIVLLKDIKK